MSEPREWWIEKVPVNHSSTIAWTNPPMRPEATIHVREVIPGRTDSDRLNWMIEKEAKIVLLVNGKFKVTIDDRSVPTDFEHIHGFNTPREAIDAAMVQEGK